MSHRLTAVFSTFEDVTDPRIERTRRHELFDLLVVALCGTIAGADSWADIERFGNERLAWLRTFLRLENGVPSHDTFGRVFSLLDPAELVACIQQWLDDLGREIGKHITIDGKTLRGSFDKAAGRNPLHLVSAWACAGDSAVGGIFESPEGFGRGWNRFWFTAVDPLPLGVIRLATGAVALYWYLTLAPDLTRLFAPGGWLPLDAVRQVEGSSAVYQLSYFPYFQSGNELWTIYALGGLVLAAFFVGWQTRITAPLALLTVLSTVHRAPLIGSQLEPLMTVVILYLALGPAGACWSVDAWRKSRAAASAATQPGRRAPSLPAGVVTRLLQVHLALLYACMGLSKLFAESWWNGSAAWSLMTRSESRLADFTWLHHHPFAVNLWTHAIVLFELGFAILIWNRLARPLLLALAVAMWCSVTLLTGQLTFLAMMLTANLAFVPGWAFDAICHSAGCRKAESPVPLGQ